MQGRTALEATLPGSASVAGHMAARSPAHRVETAPWPPGALPEQLIQVQLLRFEAPEDALAVTGEACLLATRYIVDAGEGTLLVSRKTKTEVRSPGWTVGDFDGLVGMLDTALDALAEDLVLGLGRVPAPPESPDPP